MFHHRRRSVRAPLALALAAVIGMPVGVPAASAATSDQRAATTRSVNYAPTDADIANPERGLYHHTGRCDHDDFVKSKVEKYRTVEGITLVMCIFYLKDFKNSDISSAALDQFRQQGKTVRDAGLKMIVRFAYTENEVGDDAPKARVISHLNQLATVLGEYRDVIYVVQAGFIGAWGEWHYTQNFGAPDHENYTDRKEVVDALLRAVPSERMVQLRTPRYKRAMYGTAHLPAEHAYNGSRNARLGHHNDCFLASRRDAGTYKEPVEEYPYLAAETTYLAMGGETCRLNPPRSNCPTAREELEKFHYSYLNIDHRKQVLETWTECLPEIRRRLGYRLVLRAGTYPNTASRGGPLAVNITLKNEGWAAPFNGRPVQLVLRNTSTNVVRKLALPDDPRHWLAGSTATIARTVTVPADLPAGNYALLLSLPDEVPALGARAEYSIQFANHGLWEAAKGFNKLKHTVTVT